jgi:alpha-L-arabinofuranosidase
MSRGGIGLVVLTTLGLAAGETATLTVEVRKPGAKISRGMGGALLEDMNSAIDGGLYAELVKNRFFEFPDAMTGWTARPSAPRWWIRRR